MNQSNHLHQSLQEMADGFRSGNHIALGTALPDLLAQIVEQTVHVANTSPDVVHDLIKKCLNAFELGDWLGLADLLEYEVTALPIEKTS
jgi:hypothetical protein